MILFVTSNDFLNERSNSKYPESSAARETKGKFQEWADYLSPDKNYAMVNLYGNIRINRGKTYIASQIENNPSLRNLAVSLVSGQFTKIIALGPFPSEVLDTFGVKYYKLPSPAPYNSFLNNTVQVQAVLEDCKQWLK